MEVGAERTVSHFVVVNFCTVTVTQTSSPGLLPQINNRIRGRDPLVLPLLLPLVAGGRGVGEGDDMTGLS